jgi:hypothetical protein
MTNPVIPAEAVKAAEDAVIEAMIEHGPDGHIDGYDKIARTALEAAAPYMLAEGWGQGYRAGLASMEFYGATPNPYRSNDE